MLRRQQAKSRNVKNHFCNTECKSAYQRLAKPVTKEWLEEHYLSLGLDCSQIAKIVNRDPKSVWNWMKEFGIPMRGRGFASTCKFQKGQKSVFAGRKHTPETRAKLRAKSLADGRVPYLKNGKHWLKEAGKRPASWKGGVSPDRQAFYATPEWKECVKLTWERADAKCERCGLNHREILRGIIRFDLHHVDSFMIVDRRADPTNIMLLCQPCHKWVHSKRNKKRRFLGKGH